jgi:hypothetical protein
VDPRGQARLIGLCPVDGRRADEAGAAFLTQSAAVAAVGDDLAVVQKPVEDHGGDDRIAEHGRELGGGFLGGAPAVTEPRR